MPSKTIPCAGRTMYPVLLVLTLFTMSRLLAVPTPLAPPSYVTEDQFVGAIQQQTFQYFWKDANRNATTGLILMRTDQMRCSVAGMGFALSNMCIAVERGWVTRADARARVKTILSTLYNAPQGDDPANPWSYSGYRGWFYHHLDMATATRYHASPEPDPADRPELSSIDTALFMLGVLDTRQFFDQADADEVAIRNTADALWQRVDWSFVRRSSDSLIYMHWSPENGFGSSNVWAGGNEALLLYVLALGAPAVGGSYPIPTAAWTNWTASYSWQTKAGAGNLGYSYIFKAPLFIHQYPQCWIDFRGQADAYMRGKNSDYFEDGLRAALAQRQYAIDNPNHFPNYASDEWGLTSCSGPDPLGYAARGCPNGTDDGVMAPTAALASMPYTPASSLAVARNFGTRYGSSLYSDEGFVDSFFIGSTPAQDLFANNTLAIDQGPIVMMIENHRTGSTWSRIMNSPAIIQGLSRAGFQDLLGNGWKTRDIGNVGIAGRARASSGVYTIDASGADIWGANDEFGYVYQSASGACSVTARVDSIGVGSIDVDGNGSVDPKVKAGIMIRDNLLPNSTNAALLVYHNASDGIGFQIRGTSGLTVSTKVPNKQPPYWVRLTWTPTTPGNGDARAEIKTDSGAWEQVGSVSNVPMGGGVYVGLATSGHDDADRAAAVFSNVSYTP